MTFVYNITVVLRFVWEFPRNLEEVPSGKSTKRRTNIC